MCFGDVALWEGYHEIGRCSRDTYPESYISPSILVDEDLETLRARRSSRARMRRTFLLSRSLFVDPQDAC